MIKTLYEFGKHLKNVNGMGDYFEVVGMPYTEGGKQEETVVILPIENGKPLDFRTVDFYRPDNPRYLFRELAGPRATSLVPTLHFYNSKKESELDESIAKFLDKFERSVNANKTLYNQFFDVTTVIDFVKNQFRKWAETNLKEKQNYLFTLEIDGKLLGDFPNIKRIVEDSAYDKYFRDSHAKNKTCSVTYKPSDEVWGKVGILGFTVEKLTFSRNGFNERDSYKMFPVSPEAVKILEGTWRALDKERGLTARFLTMTFLVIPHFVAITDEEVQFEIVENMVSELRRSDVATAETQVRSIVNSEKIFECILQNPLLNQKALYYDVFFYEKNQAQIAIKLHISDVLPSRFNDIVSAMDALHFKYERFLGFLDAKESIKYRISFANIRRYFSIEKFKGDDIIDPFFYKIVEAVFYTNEVNEEQVLRAFLQKIITAFKNRQPFAFADHVKRTFVIYQYFQKLQLLRIMEQNISLDIAPISTSAEDFIAQHPDFFGEKKELKKAAFTLGYATQILLNVQYRRLKSEPFTKNLNGLNIGIAQMEKISKELKRKAMDYQRVEKGLSNPESRDIDKYLDAVGKILANNRTEDISKTEISYAFSLGLVIRKELENKGRDEYNANKAKKAQAPPSV